MPFVQERAFDIAEQEHKIISQIVKARKRIGLTQKDFASKLGLKQQAISTFERAEESPSLRRLIQLAGALDMEIRVIKKRRIPVKGFRTYRKHSSESMRDHEHKLLIHEKKTEDLPLFML